ncbi:MAG TPA: hypothetical protein VML54_17185 [Candidatus Limnocylindrales bacterium]|nr:hypothetical protein [Candidatus Limnocylindrales bacterium]
MSRLRQHRIGIVPLGIIVVIGVLVVYRLKDQQARALPRPRGDSLVGVVHPTRQDLDVRITSTADLLPAKQAAIFSKVSGYIRKIHADRGDFVREGQPLPLARAVIGGLAVSTFFTLVLIPLLYVMLEERFPRDVREASLEEAPRAEPA